MATHNFTGVTAKITVSGTLTGFVSGDFSLTVATGKYVELDSVYATAHTRGLRAASGSLKKAWGVSDTTLFGFFNTDAVFDIAFDAGDDDSNTYTISGCVLTDLSMEGIEAGSEGALLLNASFEGLTWSRD